MSDINLLFDSGAFKAAPANKPFLYTSGLIGPYFINTHFVCGGEVAANQILNLIDMECRNPGFQQKLISHLEIIYSDSPIFKETIDSACNLIIKDIGLASFRYVSGGERRDWFFSPLIAKLLDKPLLWIYKDGTVLDTNGVELKDLKKEKVINVADLLTIGSSYERTWVPELKKRNGILAYSLNIVDRMQGGESVLLNLGLEKILSVFKIDNAFFEAAKSKGLIDKEQFDLMLNYKKDPHQSMRDFLVNNQEFVDQSANSSDQKIRTRIELLLLNNPYKI